MNVAFQCEKVLLVQAELDGELDAAEAASLSVHRADCAECQTAAAELSRGRSLIRDNLYYPMPEDLRRRIMAQIAAAQQAGNSDAPRQRTSLLDRLRRWWSALAGFGLGAACAAAVLLLIMTPRETGLIDQLVSSHIRALQPGHLEDVPSSDKHTVKPWFDGRIDFAPPIKDLSAQRFPLKGGRLDYIDNRPVAALVYQRDKHLINLFVWPASQNGPQEPEMSEKHGYNVVHWSASGMTFWAVSDLELNQLREFAQDWQELP